MSASQIAGFQIIETGKIFEKIFVKFHSPYMDQK